MYNVKGPSKIVANTTRRGISQNMDNVREYSRNKSTDSDDGSPGPVPRPVFNSKKPMSQQTILKQEVIITPEHEELIKFVNESWNSVWSEDCGNAELFYEDESNGFLDGFKPFDLESWWGRRMFALLTGSGSNNNTNKIN